jgi:hypothetical protein
MSDAFLIFSVVPIRSPSIMGLYFTLAWQLFVASATLFTIFHSTHNVLEVFFTQVCGSKSNASLLNYFAQSKSFDAGFSVNHLILGLNVKDDAFVLVCLDIF